MKQKRLQYKSNEDLSAARSKVHDDMILAMMGDWNELCAKYRDAQDKLKAAEVERDVFKGILAEMKKEKWSKK